MTKWQKIVIATLKKSEQLFLASKSEHALVVAKNQLIGKNAPLLVAFNAFLPVEKKLYSQELRKIKNQIQKDYQHHLASLNFQVKKKVVHQEYDHQHYQILGEKTFARLTEEEPKINFPLLAPHPIQAVIDSFHQFASKMGWDYQASADLIGIEENFTLLNIGPTHPARSLDDCFYLKGKQQVLRTHTTNMTTKTLQKYSQDQQTSNVYTVGNVYRNDTDDATHLPQFHQIDVCLVGDEQYSVASLKWILEKMCHFLFDETVKTRFRISYFPFTEPSLELDINCLFCDQKGCSICNQSGWIELLGAGIINQEVLKKCGIKNKKVVALAFGLGVERVAMLKNKIKDIRDFYSSLFEVKQNQQNDHQS